MICPDCNGDKVIRGFGCPGFRPVTLPCARCGETGEVPDWQEEAIERGLRLVKLRQSRGLSLREEAKLWGISPVMLSNIEHGRVPPSEWPGPLQEASA